MNKASDYEDVSVAALDYEDVPGAASDYEDLPSTGFQFGGGGAPAAGVTGDFGDETILSSMKHGVVGSIGGMLWNQQIPQPPGKQSFLEETTQGLTQSFLDLPFIFGGLLAGGAPGAFGLPMGIRKVIMDKYAKGDIEGAKDFLGRALGAVKETAKGELTGATVAKVGGLVPGLAKFPAEVGAATVVGAGLEGRMPTVREGASNLLIMGALHGAGKGIEALRRMPQETPRAPKEPIISPKTTTETLPGEIPKYAASVNLERQNISTEAKLLELQAAEAHPKTTETWTETGKKAAELSKDPDIIPRLKTKISEGSALNPEETKVFRDYNATTFEVLKNQIDVLTPEEFNVKYKDVQDNVFALESQEAAVQGRAFNIRKQQAGNTEVFKALGKLKGNLNERQKQDLKNVDTSNPESVRNFVKNLPDPKLREYFFEYWYNNILSGLPTHIVNVFGNTLWQTYQLPHRSLVGAIDASISKLTGRQRQVYVSEIIPMMAGYKSGFVPGAKEAWKMFSSGQVPDFVSKWHMDAGTSAGAFERSPNAVLRSKPVVFAMSGFLRALSAMDVWAKTMGLDAQSKALAWRMGKQRGLSGSFLDKFVIDKLKEMPPEIESGAKEFAKHNVFMDDPGKFTRWIEQGRKILPWESGRFVIPFLNTVSNLTQRGIELTPGVGLIFEGYKKATGQKALPTSEVIAKQIEGSILTLYMLHLIDEGRITGAVPQNPTKKDAFYREGKIPWAIRVGDNWYQYSRVQPFNMPLAAVASLYDALTDEKNYKGDNRFEKVTNLFMSTAGGVAGSVLDSSYLQGVTNLLDRYGSRRGWIQRMGSSLVPYSSFWRSINRAYEVATEGSAKVRPSNTWLGAFSQVIPGISTGIPAKLNVWGKEVEIPGGVFRQWLPFKMSEATTDPLETELERLGYYPGLPGQNVSIGGKPVKLPDELYRDYCISYGNRAKGILDNFINQPGYKNIPQDEYKVKAIKRVLDTVGEQELNMAKMKYLQQQQQKVGGVK